MLVSMALDLRTTSGKFEPVVVVRSGKRDASTPVVSVNSFVRK
jgi:hypothetical protein